MAKGPPTSSDAGILAALQQNWSGGGGSHWDPQVLDSGIDSNRLAAHRKWADGNAKWISARSKFHDIIEPQPHGGWLYRPPGPVPVSRYSRQITEYGPEDFSYLEGTGTLSFQHNKLKATEYYPRTSNVLKLFGL